MKLTRQQARSVKLQSNAYFYGLVLDPNPVSRDLAVAWFPETGLAVVHTVNPVEILLIAWVRLSWKCKAHVKTWLKNFSVLHFNYSESKINHVPPLTELNWVSDTELIAISHDIDSKEQLVEQDLLYTLDDYVQKRVVLRVNQSDAIHADLTDTNVDSILNLLGFQAKVRLK